VQAGPGVLLTSASKLSGSSQRAVGRRHHKPAPPASRTTTLTGEALGPVAHAADGLLGQRISPAAPRLTSKAGIVMSAAGIVLFLQTKPIHTFRLLTGSAGPQPTRACSRFQAGHCPGIASSRSKQGGRRSCWLPAREDGAQLAAVELLAAIP